MMNKVMSLWGGSNNAQTSGDTYTVYNIETKVISDPLAVINMVKEMNNFDYKKFGTTSDDILYPFSLGKSYSVSRRFSEFDILFAHLREHCKGIVIPTMPGKTYWSSSKDPNLIEERRIQLESFLQIIMRNLSLLKQTQAVYFFLGEQGGLKENLQTPTPLNKLKQDISTTYASMSVDKI